MLQKEELTSGIKIESEHKETIEKIIADIRAGKEKALSDYFKLIAEDHLKEIPDYYTHLKKMEDGAKSGTPKAIALIAIANKPKE